MGANDPSSTARNRNSQEPVKIKPMGLELQFALETGAGASVARKSAQVSGDSTSLPP